MITPRCLILETSQDVKLDGILFFRQKTDEGHADALISLLAHDSSEHIQSDWRFPDFEFQLNFLTHGYIHGGLQQDSAFTDVDATQGKVPVIPSAEDIREHG
jgi:hypothetical protein